MGQIHGLSFPVDMSVPEMAAIMALAEPAAKGRRRPARRAEKAHLREIREKPYSS
jgi:hypothetical protein